MKMKFLFNLNILKISVNLLTYAYLIGKINLSDEKNDNLNHVIIIIKIFALTLLRYYIFYCLDRRI